MSMKYCGAGKHHVDIALFHKKGSGTQPNCKECQNRLNRERYSNNKVSHIKHVIHNTNNRKAQFHKWKTTLKCSVCGESHPGCLDFHHIDSSEKDFAISDALSKRGWQLIIDELRKCAVLCSNCHRKLHDGVIDPKLTALDEEIVILLQIIGLQALR